MPLSSLSFSWFALFQRIPGTCQIPADRCCHRQTPDASVRYPNLRAFHPIGHVWLWSESRRGIWKLLNFRTRFESNGSAEFHVRVFPARPHSRRIKCMR
jgi:hypothetical protein